MTPKQQKFVEEYLVDLNATQAAIRAGYSQKTAGKIGFENLQKPEIQAAIQGEQQKLSEKTGISAERVLRELERLSFSSLRDFLTWGPGGVVVRDSATLTEAQAACISEISQTSTEFGRNIVVKLHSKDRALEKLGRHLGLFDIERFKHERDMATLDRNALKEAISEIPVLAYFEHEPPSEDDSPAE